MTSGPAPGWREILHRVGVAVPGEIEVQPRPVSPWVSRARVSMASASGALLILGVATRRWAMVVAHALLVTSMLVQIWLARRDERRLR